MNNMGCDTMCKESGGKYINKRMLLICNRGGYAEHIMEQASKLGIQVDYMNDKPSDGVLHKIFGRIKLSGYINLLNHYYKNQIDKKNKKYDVILVIRGEYTPVESLRLLKEKYNTATLILYMWDSIKNNKGIEKKWSLFDKVITFDRKDYLDNKEKIDFLPLFYCDDLMETISKKTNRKYNICFIGTGHGDRVQIIKKLKNQCNTLGLSIYDYIYLPHPIVYLYNKLANKYYKNVKISDIHFHPMPLERVYKIFCLSDCIVDIESKTQTGLTMRTIEVLGLKKKLITTNKDILNYDFYDSNNIFIVDRNNFNLDYKFITNTYTEIDKLIYDKYSLKNWIEQILSYV